MNGLLAAIFWTSTLVHPSNSILDGTARQTVKPFITAGYSALEYQRERVGNEIQVSFAQKYSHGPLQEISSFSITDEGGIWLGSGFYNEIPIQERLSFGFSFLPGVYLQRDEVDLGGWLMFRSGLQLNFQVNDFISLSVSYDHRSSGDIWPFNPGLETLQIKFRHYL